MKRFNITKSLGMSLAAGLMFTITPFATHGQGCEKVVAEGIAQLGLIEVAPGVFTLGALPTPVVVAGVPGLMSSIVTSQRGNKGALHYTLVHTFVSTDGARPGGFTTSDRAVAAPAGVDPNTGIVNDVLTVVGGTGVFANAEGIIVNHALLDLSNFTLTFSMHGQVCADGL
jgi:hypothetical protein